MKSNLSLIVSLVICCLFSEDLFAQCGNAGVYCHELGLHHLCEGTYLDNGGNGVYLEESSSIAFCPGLEGHRSSLTFSEFDLDLSNGSNSSDKLYIYDGTSDSDSLIGIFSGTSLLGQTITASNSNPSGCLLLKFYSNGGGNTSHTGWVASIGCVQPCAPPHANASVLNAIQENNIFLNCVSDEILFSSEGSSAAEGHTLENYVWHFMDGSSTVTSDISTSHLYNDDAIYNVRLIVLDDVGCADDTIFHVGVVGAPIINVPAELNACVGAEVILDAAYEAQTIVNAVNYTDNTMTYLADGSGFSYAISLEIASFAPGATINSCNEFVGVFVNMEHSYMGDLGISLTCPNGTTVSLVEWGVNGGGGTFLGEALDDNTSEPGIGYDYYWATNATNGTWGENADFGSSILPSGSYEAYGNLCNMVGCPLNGVWNLTVTDNLPIDNGYVFGWGIGIAPVIDGQLLSYTPVINSDASSSYWSGESITFLSENADTAIINTTAIGSNNLQYTTIDNVGCTFTSDFEVNVIENPIVITLDDYFVYSEFNTSLFADISGIEISNTTEMMWLPAAGLSNPNYSYTEVLVPNDVDSYTLTVTSPAYIGCVAQDSISMNLPELTVSGYTFLDANQNGVFDTDESPLGNFPIYNSDGTLTYSNAEGYYSVYCTYGSNTISLSVNTSLWYATTSTSFTTVLNDGNFESINNNFGIMPNGSPETIIHGNISNVNTWCLTEGLQTLSVSNNGNTIVSGHIVYTFDPLCTYVSATPEPYQIVDNSLYFSYADLTYNQTELFHVLLDMPDNAELDNLLDFSLSTYYLDTAQLVFEGSDQIVSLLVCSYDPNDKREFNGTGENGQVSPNSVLDYVIRFQNTGTAPAFDVLIIDQLPYQVLFNTLYPVASSHPYTINVSAAGVATFLFDNIMLPDSSSDFEGSNGFIHFRINLAPGWPAGTLIHNEASIYFDANSPIVTNQTTNTIFYCTGEGLNISVNEMEIEILDQISSVQWYFNGTPIPSPGPILTATQTGIYYVTATLLNGCIASSSEIYIVGVSDLMANKYSIYPNPTSNIANLQLGSTPSNVVVTNTLGQSVITLSNVLGLQQIDCSSLSRGTYIIQVSSNQSSTRLKLFVE